MLKWLKKRKSTRLVRKLMVVIFKYNWRDRPSICDVINHKYFLTNDAKLEDFDYNLNYLFENF